MYTSLIDLDLNLNGYQSESESGFTFYGYLDLHIERLILTATLVSKTGDILTRKMFSGNF